VRTHCLHIAASIVLMGARLATADITVEEAHDLAEDSVSAVLGPEPVRMDEAPTGPKIATFAGTLDTGQEVRVMVELTDGVLGGYMRDGAWTSEGDPGPNVSAAEAERVAREEARRILGEQAENLTWKPIRTPSGRDYKFDADGPLLGDPPRRGLSPHVTVSVSDRDGMVISYSQIMPTEDAPIPVTVSRDEALRIATGRLVPGGHEIVREPYLYQRWGRVEWRFTVRAPRPADDPAARLGDAAYDFRIDAATGEVIDTAATRAASRPPSAPVPWPLIATAAAVIVAAGLGLVLVRRRR